MINDKMDIGEHIFFGSYLGKYNDKLHTFVQQKIEWIVIEKNDTSCLLISKDCIDCISYHNTWEDITWETCTLRIWCNRIFYQNAFSDSERAQIETVETINMHNPTYGTEAGNHTQDRVFALSIEETNRYLKHKKMRRAKITDYARHNGALDNDGYGWWWLRSPGSLYDYAAIVQPDGTIIESGYDVNDENYSIRPAVRIKKY